MLVLEKKRFLFNEDEEEKIRNPKRDYRIESNLSQEIELKNKSHPYPFDSLFTTTPFIHTKNRCNDNDKIENIPRNCKIFIM